MVPEAVMALLPAAAAVIPRTNVQQRVQCMQIRSAVAPDPNSPSRRVQFMHIASAEVAPNLGSPSKRMQFLQTSSASGAPNPNNPGKRMRLRAAGQPPEALEEMALESELGVSYEALRDKLATGAWEAADAETRRLLCVLAGDQAVKRKWVYFSEVQFIPEADLKTVDGLWRAYSGNKFGYSVQRRVWRNVNQSWTAFFSKVGWTRSMLDSRNDAYKKFPLDFMWDVADPTPIGHLPLTNALRGTQLLEKLLSHPAFACVDDEQILPDLDNSLIQPLSSSPRPPQQSEQQRQRAVIPDDLTVDYGF